MRQQWEQRRGEPVTFFSNTSVHPLSRLHPERLFLESNVKCQSVKRCGVGGFLPTSALKHTYQLVRGMPGHYLTQGHIHITPAVAVMDSCFALMGAHQHGILIRSMSRQIHVSQTLYCHGWWEQSTPLSARQVVVVGRQLQNSSPTACVDKKFTSSTRFVRLSAWGK